VEKAQRWGSKGNSKTMARIWQQESIDESIATAMRV